MWGSGENRFAGTVLWRSVPVNPSGYGMVEARQMKYLDAYQLWYKRKPTICDTIARLESSFRIGSFLSDRFVAI